MIEFILLLTMVKRPTQVEVLPNQNEIIIKVKAKFLPR